MDSNESPIEKKIDQITKQLDLIQNNYTQISPIKRSPIKILLFSAILTTSIFLAIILTFTTKDSKPISKQIAISESKKGIRVIKIYNIIEYEKMVPYVKLLLNHAKQNKNIVGVLLKINSGGGTVGASQEIYHMIKQFKKETKKPVIAVLGDIAASGGYYIACASDKIVARPGTLTGSIGVIMGGFTFKELFKKIGIKQEIIKSGKFKDIGSAIDRDKTKDEKELLQNIVNDTYKQFVNAVLEGRKNLTKDTLKPYADGRIFNGVMAKEIGLIDNLGGIEEAKNLMMTILKTKNDLLLIEDSKSKLAELLEGLGFKNKYTSIGDFIKNYSNDLPLYIYHYKAISK